MIYFRILIIYEHPGFSNLSEVQLSFGRLPNHLGPIASGGLAHHGVEKDMNCHLLMPPSCHFLEGIGTWEKTNTVIIYDNWELGVKNFSKIFCTKHECIKKRI